MKFLDVHPSKILILLTGLSGFTYFLGLLFIFPIDSAVLFALFLFGESFRLWQLATYLFTVWQTEYHPPFDEAFSPPVDVFITVCGEPLEIVEETVLAAKSMRYPNFSIFILNDGFVAGKENWYEMEELALRTGVTCLTRQKPGGAKAGNINAALRMTEGSLVVIFDADHVPHPDFLEKTVGYFVDPLMGFVQTPQYYKNYSLNQTTKGAWEQQEIFFGPIKKGKNRLNATFMCGTNMVLRRRALLDAGGMCETNIAEDFLTSLFIHERGWKSYYVSEVLAEGLAPEDLLSYTKQQFRWARGSLEIIFRYNPLFRRGLSFAQKIQYLASSSFYLSGLISFLNMLFPVIFLFTGKMIFDISTMMLAAIFIPYIILVLYLIASTTNFSFTFRALTFTMGSFPIHLRALFSVIRNRESSFVVTSKVGLKGVFLNLIAPHILYGLVVIAGTIYAIKTRGISDALLTNVAWAGLSLACLLPFMRAAFPERTPARIREEKRFSFFSALKRSLGRSFTIF